MIDVFPKWFKENGGEKTMYVEVENEFRLNERLQKLEDVIKNLSKSYTLKVTFTDGRIISYKNIARHYTDGGLFNGSRKLKAYTFGETSEFPSLVIDDDQIDIIEKVEV